MKMDEFLKTHAEPTVRQHMAATVPGLMAILVDKLLYDLREKTVLIDEKSPNTADINRTQMLAVEVDLYFTNAGNAMPAIRSTDRGRGNDYDYVDVRKLLRAIFHYLEEGALDELARKGRK